MPRRLPEGLYETLITRTLRGAINEARQAGLEVDEEAAAGELLNTLLTRHLNQDLTLALNDAEDPLTFASALSANLAGNADPFESPAAVLRAVRAVHRQLPFTNAPLSVSGLLTGANGEPRLGLELEREVGSADEVDGLVSFVTFDGWRRLRPALEALAQRGGRLRLITTTYVGATDADAVAAIARLPNASVRVSYDARRTRLHAKAWLFRRHSGFSSAWVGSANLSNAALSGGLEWVLRASQIDLPHVVDKFTGTFDTLWNDEEFEAFDPARDLERLRDAIAAERGSRTPGSTVQFFAHLRPYPFQEEILDKLRVERDLHSRQRNLVVAATGTGKTLIAAFDYARQVPDSGLKPKLLFVAHRDELIGQSLDAFRHVLRDGAFGQRLGAGYEPDSYDHLFTTVQSFGSRQLADKLGTNYWDYVVVDECHHATADTWRTVVQRLEPKLMLGLTATPERTDGEPITPFFCHAVAAEIRLWHALDRQLLAPFDYFAISDQTDLSQLSWQRGAYDVGELDRLYTGNDRRADLVLEQLRRHRGELRTARMLGFCTSVSHAEFMAKHFARAGVPAAAVHGDSPDSERRTARERLESCAVNIIFTCDLYNEGVDLPFVDTVLFLRPTQSPTVFLQQLGRGLRLHKGKSSCLVLDFVGHARAEFRFDRLFTAFTGIPRGRLVAAVEAGFPTLPSGCSIRLDSVARQEVLANLRQTLQGGPRRLANELLELSRIRGHDITLAEFLADSGRTLEEVYRPNVGGFMSLRRFAGLDDQDFTEAEEQVGNGLRQLIHVDDPAQLALMERIARGEASAIEGRRLLMIGSQLWHGVKDRFDAAEVLSRFANAPRHRRELAQLADVLRDRVGLAPLAEVPADWPLQLHRAYERREVLAATGIWSATSKPSMREGTISVGDTDEIFFVTLVKDEERFSPTTRYRDYAVSRELFHWQTRSTTSDTSPTGQRYQKNGARFWLFVRRDQEEPFRFLGQALYVAHEGSRPMSITWRLRNAMPASLFQQYASLQVA